MEQIIGENKNLRNVYDFRPDEWGTTARSIVLEIEVREHKFSQQDCLMVQIRNVTKVIDNNNLQRQISRDKNLFQSMQHEIVNQLNGIVSVSDMLLTERSERQKNKLAQNISSGAHQVWYFVNSRLTQFQIENSTFSAQLDKIGATQLRGKIDKIIKPFYLESKQANFTFQVFN